MRILALLLLLLVLSTGANATDKTYNAQTATLSNGMEVVVVPIHRTPALTHMVWYKAGAGEEPWGVSGIAHFLEHLAFKGTPNVPSGKFSETIQKMGGQDNAFTSWDYTAYYQSVPKEKLADVMRMESERMNNLTPKITEVYSEKQVVIEERRQTIESDPARILGERINQALFPNHPYGRPIIGWMPEMQKLKWVDALAFYKQWYAPNNAVLVISGDTTLKDVLPLAEATYGQLKREVTPMRERPIIPKMDGDVRITLARADVREAEWVRGWRAPSARQNGEAELALSLLADLLGGNTGHLYQELVVKQKIASSADVAYTNYAWDDSTFTVYVTPAAGITLDKIEIAVKKLLAAIAAKGFTEAEVKTSVTRIQDEAVYARDSLSGPAMNIGFALATGVPLADVETWPKRLEAVTGADALDALKKYILGAYGVTGWLLPEAGAQ